MKNNTNKIILILGIFIALLLPNLFLLCKAFRGPYINAENASQFGDFIGGYLGTIFSFISIVMILISLNQQLKSDKQNKKYQYIEKFENKYFEMIRLHRDNVMEIKIGNEVGKKVFVSMLREYREIVLLINDYLCNNKYQLKIEDKYNIAYCAFYYGVGPNSSRVLKCALKQYDDTFVDSLLELLEQEDTKKKIRQNRNLKYTPLEGHQSRLGHYYRHLFQAFCYVDNQPYMDFNKKYNYAKILRAQLTNHEQAILFLNSISVLGNDWREKELITKYRLIKNLPEEFFDKLNEIDVKKVYPNIDFEWEDITQ